MTETPVWVQLANLLAAVLFILTLKGLSHPKTARRGVMLGALGAAIATFVVFFSGIPTDNLILILVAILIGSAIGLYAARRVAMTQMPQMVALFNGVGGGAAALVSVIEFLENPGSSSLILAATVFTVVVGSVSFSGSIVTFLKLQELITTRPLVIPLGKYITILVAAATLAGAVCLAAGGLAGVGSDLRCAVRAAGGWCRRSDRNFLAERIYRPIGCGRWLCPR
jgi:NAD(P) transhydrogenase subunit beta